MLREVIRGLLASAMGVFLLGGYGYGRHTYVAGLNAEQVAPPTNSPARAVCSAQSRAQFPGFYNLLDVNCSWSGLSGPLVNAEIYLARVPQIHCTLANSGGISGALSHTCASIFDGWPLWDQYTMRKELRLILRTQNFPNGEIQGTLKLVTLDYDIDGDGRTDAAVFRPANGTTYALSSTTGNTIARQFPGSYLENRTFSADFDGDGIADLASCHIDWNTGEWLWIYTRSSDYALTQTSWGNEWLNDQEAYGDFDGDGRTDVAVFRGDTGIWYITPSSNGRPIYDQFGTLGDRAMPADYDGDGKTDLAVVREENGRLAWYIRRSADGSFYRVEWGLASDTIFPGRPADVDGDGTNDILVARNVSTGSETGWEQRYFYALRSSDQNWLAVPWGVSTDGVRLGDFDGDGKTEFAAIRPIDGHLTWFVSPGKLGSMSVFNWGVTGDE